MDAELLGERIKAFECQRCNECCRQPGFVYLEDGEAERIAQFLNMDIYNFTERYCAIQDRRKLVLKKMMDESCIFLTEEGCSIHSVKPKQCVDFPISWRTEQSFFYCKGLNVLK